MGVSKDRFGWLNRIRTPFLFCHWMKPHISPVSSTTNEATKSLKNFPSVSASGNISLLFHCLIFAGKVQTWQPSGLSFPFENTLFVTYQYSTNHLLWVKVFLRTCFTHWPSEIAIFCKGNSQILVDNKKSWTWMGSFPESLVIGAFSDWLETKGNSPKRVHMDEHP